MEPSSPHAVSRPSSAEALAIHPPLTWPEGGRAIYVPAEQGQPTVLFLHGWVMNRSAWAEAAAPLLARGYGLLLPDLPGFGEARELPSDVSPRAYFPEVARRLLLGMDSLGLDQVALAGYSMGGTTALALMRAAPERFPHALLLGPLVGSSVFQVAHNSWSSFTRLCGNIGRALRGPHARSLLRAVPGLALAGAPSPGGLVHWVAETSADGTRLPAESRFGSFVGTGPGCEIDVFLGGLVRTDFRTTLRSLRASHTLPYAQILAGYRGALTLATGSLDALSPPRFMQRLARLAPASGGRMHVVEGADHVALSQTPGEVSRLLLRWLDEPVVAGVTSEYEVQEHHRQVTA